MYPGSLTIFLSKNASYLNLIDGVHRAACLCEPLACALCYGFFFIQKGFACDLLLDIHHLFLFSVAIICIGRVEGWETSHIKDGQNTSIVRLNIYIEKVRSALAPEEPPAETIMTHKE
jgi:hypothetical protein